MTEMYCRLFYDADENNREQKGFRLPAIVPIVLYNGADEWSCVRSFKEYLAGYEMFVPNVIDFEYIMINVNAPDEEELINMPTLVNLAMLLDRKSDRENMMRRLRTALKISKRLTPDEREELTDWVYDVLLKKMQGKLDKAKLEEIRKSFEQEDENDMTYAIERVIDEAVRDGEVRGEARKALETARAMLSYGDPIEKVVLITGIPVDELRHHINEHSDPQ
jgi:predicted transposase/invertase (TIGR01784 family)